MRRLIGLFFSVYKHSDYVFGCAKARIIENISLFLPVLCKCMSGRKGTEQKDFSSLDFIYLQSPSIYCSSNMAPIPVNMEINAYFISI